MYSILIILKQRNAVGQILVFAVIAALVLGLVGHVQLALSQLPEEAKSPGRVAKVVMDSIPAAMRVFTPKLNPDPGSNGWALTIGELLGALAAFAALLAVIVTILAEYWEKVRISLLRKHTVLVGLDRNAVLFLNAQARAIGSETFVVMDTDANEASRSHAHAEGCYHYAADDSRQIDHHLKSCAVKRARRLVISTGDDDKNLEILRSIAASSALAKCEALDVLLVIEDAFTLHRLEESHAFMQCLGESARLRLFSPSTAAAFDLFSKVNLTQFAHSRGHSRAVLLIIGQDDTATEVVCQFLKLSPSVGMDKPQIHWIVQNRAHAISKLAETVPPLSTLIRDKKPGLALAWAAEITMHEPSAIEAPNDRVFLENVIGQSTASSIVVTGATEGTETSIRIAHAIRETARHIPALCAPIFVFSPKVSALDELLNRTDATSEICDDVIEPFGRVVEMENWGAGDVKRERYAQALHEKYLQKRSTDTGTNDERDDSRKPWENLSETYKNANRRAAFQVEMASYWLDQLRGSSHGELDAKSLETLARLEHDAWSIDRELDGWRYAPERDNIRKLHPNLVPYDQLSDEIKEYDRAQVRNFLEVAAEE